MFRIFVRLSEQVLLVTEGSMFMYKGKNKAVLINYHEQNTLVNDFYTQV